MNRLTFQRETIANSLRFSKLMINQLGDDYLVETLTASMTAFVLTRTNEEKTITIYKSRPKFLDWLLRRPQQFLVTVKCKEVLKSPPSLSDSPTYFIYEVKQA